MPYLLCKLLLLAGSLSMALTSYSTGQCVPATLLVLSFSGMTVFFWKKRFVYFFILTGCLLSIVLPPVGLFTSVFAYDCGTSELSVREKCLLFGCTVLTLLSLYRQVPLTLLVTGLCFLALGIVASICLIDIRDLKDTIRKNRDTDKELQLLLEQKHADLLEKSEYEIEAATLRERNRIAREIHDNVGHLLTRSILQVGALNTINKNEAIAPHFEQLSDTLNQAMDSIRASVHNLYQTDLDLYTSLQTYFATVSTLDIRLEYEVRQLSREMSCHFLAIIKEAVYNTTKHSNADHIDIQIIEHPVFYQLCIEDNGSGKNKTALPPGMGLTSMRDRVRLMHGTMEIFHEQGFRIFITIMK